MADSKKTAKKSEPKAKQPPASNAVAAAASTPKKGAAKKTAKAATENMPQINTSNAAEAAAKMIAHKLASAVGGNATGSAAKHESASFRQLKEGLNKSASQGAASFIQSTAPTKKSSQHFGRPNQVGHNQTFGADVNRSGVPRRTGGG